MEMRMQQFGTPQHPSVQMIHWGIKPQGFRTPQHPSTATNDQWGGGTQSLRFDSWTPDPYFQAAHDYWDGDLPSEFCTPQHKAASGKTKNKNYWGTVDGKRQFGTPLSPAAFRTKNHEPDLGGGFSTPQRQAAAAATGKNRWGTVDGARQFGTPLRTKNLDTDLVGFITPQRQAAATGKNHWGTADGARQFGTPQHPSAFREFRTPQHPSQGTNNWGGASPMLARNIPQESLERRYERLNTLRTQDQIFTPVDQPDDDFIYSNSRIEANYAYESTPNPAQNPNPNPPSRRSGFLWKLIRREPKDQNSKEVGNPSKKKRRWFPKLNMQKRWPTGW